MSSLPTPSCDPVLPGGLPPYVPYESLLCGLYTPVIIVPGVEAACGMIGVPSPHPRPVMRSLSRQ